jgi:fermentation-respiration switch protein FrsA (DUF1100 family)
MRKEIAVLLFCALAAYPLVVLAAYCTQSYVIFQSRGISQAPPPQFNIDERILTTPDGELLHAWWLQTPHAEKTALYFQANGTNISYRPSRLKTFRKMGLNALMIDYRGYGKSTGRIKSEANIYTDGLTAWHFLTTTQEIPPEQIIIWGRSLGGGVATEIARSRNIAALVLESSFFSLDEVARHQFWFLPTSRLLKFHFDNGRKLKDIIAPVVIIHSAEDDYIPFRHAARLFAAAADPKFMLETTGSHLETFDDRAPSVKALMRYLGLSGPNASRRPQQINRGA